MTTLSVRDPVHGFIRADALEAALIESRPLQRLRSVRQLGLMYLVFPGAEHSRFSHALGAMELAGRLYDALADRAPDLLDPALDSPSRRLLRLAALWHDAGHAPFSHTAEDLFDSGIDHEEMTCRLLDLPEVAEIFERHGRGLEPAEVRALLRGGTGEIGRLMGQVISGDLDVDKMDYLLRDSLFCGVRYGSYDLERILDTVIPLRDPDTGQWGIGVENGGVHALEALVMARYYMFTQVYLNVTGKVLELHLNEWLRQEGMRWSSDPEEFLQEDDVSVLYRMRRSTSPHAMAVVARRHYDLAFETKEHLAPEEKARFDRELEPLGCRFSGRLLISNSSKDPHRLGRTRLLVRTRDGGLESMEKASHFIGHLKRIERYRVYCHPAIARQVRASLAGVRDLGA